MSQTSILNVDGNDNGADYTVKLNDIINALTTAFSGSTAPTTTVAFMTWLDTSTTPYTLKRRDSANSSWVSIGQFDAGKFYGDVVATSNISTPLVTITSIGARILGTFDTFSAGSYAGLTAFRNINPVYGTTLGAWGGTGGVGGSFIAYGTSTPDTSPYLSFSSNSTGYQVIDSGSTGGTTALPIRFNSEGYLGSFTIKKQSIVLNTTATAPASPSAGEIYFDSTTNQFKGYNGTSWSVLG